MNDAFDFSADGKYRNMTKELSIARFILIDRVIATSAPVSVDIAASLCDGGQLIDKLLAGNYIGLDNKLAQRML